MFIPIIVLGVLVIGFYYVINRDLKADHALVKSRKDRICRAKCYRPDGD